MVGSIGLVVFDPLQSFVLMTSRIDRSSNLFQSLDATRLRGATLALVALMLSGCATVDAMRRVEVDFGYVSGIAAERAQRKYREPGPLPETLRNLSYDEYHKIRYNNDKYMWRDEGLSFAAGFFHLGYLYAEGIKVHEFTQTHEQHIRYLPAFFEFEDKALESSLPSSLDYAGFRLSTNLENGQRYAEFVSFLGASYFRAIGYGHRYGASARGIAVNAGLSDPEEFPRFTEVWLGKPLGNSQEMVVYALLEGPSITGAYQFVLRPGVETVIDVKARLFMRETVKSFGVAPLTSMYWRGENRASPERDFRPEVHDSDGVIILERDKDPVWRALDLDTKTRLSYFAVNSFKGFGLMQRDRAFESYQDMEADYHLRPSVLVEAKGDWGSGFAKLVELPTANEFEDNVILFWEPTVLPEKGDVLNYEYTMRWTSAAAPSDYPAARVASTRLGEDLSYPGTHVFVVEFGGVERREEPPEVIATVGAPSALRDSRVMWNPHSNAWRVMLRLDTVGPDDPAVELRCQLRFADESVSEVWAYQWTR